MNVNIKNFNWEFYINKHNDLRNNGINSKITAWNHWIKFGKKENRLLK